MVCPEAIVEQVVAAMRSAHSYEEPAFDVYPLRPLRAKTGAGRFGHLPQPLPLRRFAEMVKAVLGAAVVQMSGAEQQPVQRVALACGAAGEFLKDALRQKADVFLTGEMRFHDCLTAQAQRLGVILPGHYATERCGVEELARILHAKFPQLHVWASQQEREPLAGV
jgi:putative NIF3 family GTP cyclohydrolase 1 type 2